MRLRLRSAAGRADRSEGSLLRVPVAIGLLPAFAGLLAAAVGLAVVAGWFSDSGTLAQVGFHGASMKLSTAFATAAVGGAMALSTVRRAPRLAIGLCVAVVLLALVAVLDWTFSISLGLQRLLPADPVSTTISRTAPPHTAVVLALLAGALLTLHARHRRAHRVLVCCTLAGTLLSAIGYIYGASTSSGISSFTGMTLVSLITLTLLSGALVVLGIDRGLELTLVHRGAAGQLTRRILPAALIAPLLLGALALVGETAGAYDARNGFALFAWAMAAVFSLLVLRFTGALRVREDAQIAAETAMLEARAEIDGFFALALELMAIADADGRFIRVNPQFEQTLGYSMAELTGRPFAEFIHPDDVESTMARFATHAQGSAVANFENRYRCKDGSYRWLLWSATGASHGGFVYSTARDVTERREMEDRLRASEHEALEASRSKSEFVASMSHELRTPLNGVIGMASLLSRTSLDAAQSGYVNALEASSEALLAVISDVLDFSKMEAGHLELDRSAFDLRETVEAATQMLAGQAHAKGLEIAHWVEADVPVSVDGDRARLRQILLNLLSNAVKFTAAGEVTLRVRRGADEMLHFAVSDTGIGIDDDTAAALFEPFAQADQSTTRQYGGTGLGLAISRRLVDLMSGEIGAERREGGGSVFWFTALMPPAQGIAQAAQDRPDLQSRRTLVVDDNATNRTILEQYLRGWGIACESVDRPSAALDALERASRDGQPFELAMIDFKLPQMDGVALVREIRARPALGALKIVMLSSAGFRSGRLAGLDVAATLTKPASQATIYAAIADALAGRPTAVAFPAAGDQRATNRNARVLIAEDNEINYTVAHMLLAELGIETELASDGREAIEMAATHDYAAIFMDCQMPVVDGFDATRRIREAELGRRVPIIAMTALSLPGDRERCLAAGMDDYLSKPIRGDELEAAVRRCIPAGRSRRPRPVGDQGPRADDGDELKGVLDEAAVLRIRESLTPAKFAQLVATFDAQQEKCVIAIGGAIERGDRAEVRSVAHKLKGSSASLGALRLRDRCQQLELGREADSELGEPQIAELRVIAAEASAALRHELTH